MEVRLNISVQQSNLVNLCSSVFVPKLFPSLPVTMLAATERKLSFPKILETAVISGFS